MGVGGIVIGENVLLETWGKVSRAKSVKGQSVQGGTVCSPVILVIHLYM